MLQIDGNTVYLTRGDDAVLEMQPVAESGEAYAMQAGDVLTLTVREEPSAESQILFQIQSAPGSTRIVIRHEDTETVDVGRYSADIQLNTADGKRFTLWPELEGSYRYSVRNFRNFILMPEVTRL